MGTERITLWRWADQTHWRVGGAPSARKREIVGVDAVTRVVIPAEDHERVVEAARAVVNAQSHTPRQMALRDLRAALGESDR